MKWDGGCCACDLRGMGGWVGGLRAVSECVYDGNLVTLSVRSSICVQQPKSSHLQPQPPHASIHPGKSTLTFHTSSCANAVCERSPSP